MTISELSNEDKERLSEKYKALDEMVKSRENMDEIISPLNDRLSELEKEEEELSVEYDEIVRSSREQFSSKQTSRLVSITNKNVEISKEKDRIRQEIAKYSAEFFEVRQSVENIEKEIKELLTSKKQGSIFSENDDVVILDKHGNVVDKIVVESNNFLNVLSGVEIKIGNSKNTIIKTSKSVGNYIKESFEKVKKFEFHPIGMLKTNIDKFYKNHISEIVEAAKESYHEEEKRVQDIIDKFNKEKEEKIKTAQAADNLEFVANIQKQTEANDINKNLYYNVPQLENQDAKEEGFKFVVEPEEMDEKNQATFDDINSGYNPLQLEDQTTKEEGFIFIEEPALEVLDKDNKEVMEAKEINLNDVSMIVDNQVQENKRMVDENDNLIKQETIKEDNITDIFTNVKSEVISFTTDQFVSIKKNKIVKSTITKAEKLAKLFETIKDVDVKDISSTIGKKFGEILSKQKLDKAKKEALKDASLQKSQKLAEEIEQHKIERQILEEKKQQQIQIIEQQYNNQVDEIENIFSGRTMAA